MPFGEFKDFAQCVAKNQGVGNPEAFCAALHKKITGKFPTEASSMGFYQLMVATQLSLSTVPNVKIICKGSFTDANGKGFAPTSKDLTSIVSAYNDGIFSRIPVKLGHTSDSFNQQVAKAFGLPALVLEGEGDGQRGAANLGEFKNFRLVDDTVVADVEVQEPIAGMVKEKLIRSLSMEIYNDLVVDGKKYSMAVRAGSLLGMENPALPLDDLTVLANGLAPNHVMLSLFQTLADEPPDAQFQGFPLYEVPIENRESKRIEFIHVNAKSANDAQAVAIGAAEKLTGESATIIGKAIGGIIAILLGKKFLFGKGKLVSGAKGGGDAAGKIKGLLFTEFIVNGQKFGLFDGQPIQLDEHGFGIPGDGLPTLPTMTPNSPYNVMLIETETGAVETLTITAVTKEEAIAKALLMMGDGWEFSDIVIPGEPLAASSQLTEHSKFKVILTKTGVKFGDPSPGSTGNMEGTKSATIIAESSGAAVKKAEAMFPGWKATDVIHLQEGEPIMASYSVSLSKGDEKKTVTVEADTPDMAKSKAGSSNSGWSVGAASIKSSASEAELVVGSIRTVLAIDGSADILEAIKALKVQSTTELSEVSTQLLSANGRIQVLEKVQRQAHWLSETSTLKIAGKPTELATQLVQLEEKGGLQTAQMLLDQWKSLSDLTESNGWFDGRLSPSEEGGGDDGFMAQVSKLTEANPEKTAADVMKLAIAKFPGEYQTYARITGGR